MAEIVAIRLAQNCDEHNGRGKHRHAVALVLEALADHADDVSEVSDDASPENHEKIDELQEPGDDLVRHRAHGVGATACGLIRGPARNVRDGKPVADCAERHRLAFLQICQKRTPTPKDPRSRSALPRNHSSNTPLISSDEPNVYAFPI